VKNVTPARGKVGWAIEASLRDAMIPSKLESLAFGQDVMVDGSLKHTDSSTVRYDNQSFVFAFDAADLGGSAFVQQAIAAVPEPESYALILLVLGVVGFVSRSRRKAN
jgi:hypothetical protein